MAQCGICLEDLREDGASHTTVCEHTFHNQCITRWLLTKSTCPCCRHDLGGNGGAGDQSFDTGEDDNERGTTTIFQIYNGQYITESDEDYVIHLGEILAVGVTEDLYPKRWKQRKEGWTSTFTGSNKQRFLVRADVLERETEGAPPHLVALDVTPLASTAEIEDKIRIKHKLSTKGGGKQWRSAKQLQRRTSQFKTTTRRC